MSKINLETEYQNAKKKYEQLKSRIVEVNTKIKISKEQHKKAIEEMKERFGVETFEELREYRKQKNQENIQNMQTLTALLEEKEKEVTAAEQKIEQAKQQLNDS